MKEEFAETVLSMLSTESVAIECKPFIGSLLLVTIKSGGKTREFVMNSRDMKILHEREQNV
jgi:hypothetical protein